MGIRPRTLFGFLTGLLLFGAGSCANSGQGDAMDPDRSYQPRFVDASGEHPHTNRLAQETSPYLLQHAHNPVDWYPWGEAAFAAARAQDKPVFLSVGYSTCYWCHVMERESFENEAVAAVMNAHFICIKVDREERPDIDDLYMSAVQLFSNGRGGWPMSVFLEPGALKPFYGGTYFPAQDLQGRPGFVTLLERVSQLWADDRAPLLAQADRAADAIREDLQAAGAPAPVGVADVQSAIEQLLAGYDPVQGGFDRAPKFPQPGRIQFLQQAGRNNAAVRAAVHHTLDAMAMGGMYDQVGGGFHRYSTDERWLVPHFEKMLYDNALLAEVYAQSIEAEPDPYHARVLGQTLDYVLREMTDKSGRFYSAQDAEVDASEGQSYVWTRAQALDALDAAHDAADSTFVQEIYALDGAPNFRDPHNQQATPVYVLHLTHRPQETEFARLDRINAALLARRNARKQPVTDDKSLAAWNGLMIAGMAEGGRVLQDERYLEAARRAADFVLTNMSNEGAELQRSYRAGRASIPAYLEDHAFLAHGLFRLYAATGTDRWRDAALTLLAEARKFFADPESGGYFDSRAGQADLFVRLRSRYDGATPSGNSVMLLNLLDAYAATGDESWLTDAAATLGSMSQRIARHPTALTVALCGLDRIANGWPDRLPMDTSPSVGPPSPVEASITPPDEQGEFVIRLDIAEGFHVNAHDPADPDLVGFNAQLVGTGCQLELEYPPGAAFTAPFSQSPIRVYAGVVELNATLTRTDPESSALRLVLRWQACDETSCLAPSGQSFELGLDHH